MDSEADRTAGGTMRAAGRGDDQPVPSSLIRFSLDEVPERDRAAMLCDFIGRHMRRVHIEPTDHDAPLVYNAQVDVLPGVLWGGVQMSQVRAQRTGTLLDDGNDDIMLFAPSSGLTVSHPSGGASLEIEPGSVLMMSQARAATTVYHGPAETFAFQFKRAHLAEFIPNLGEAPRAVLRADTPGLGLLFGYGRMLHRDPLSRPAAFRSEIARHLQQLAALVIGASPDAQEYIEQTGVAAARLAAIKADIREGIGRWDVSAQAVALRHGITPRHLHRLFEREENTFSEFVTKERLAQAHRTLTNPHRMVGRISDIAFATGFADLSTFNRQFKRQFGMTPSELRAANGKRTE